MRWIIKTLTSSLGKKLIMSLTGLFLVLFLVIHLLGNFQLLVDDGGESFNLYTYFMTHNPLIKTVSILLYVFILLHAVQGILLKMENSKARPVKYAVAKYPGASTASKQMALLGILVFAFLCIHMGDFWYKMKFTDSLEAVQYAGVQYEVYDLYSRVAISFSEVWIVVVYLIGLVALAIHLWHGFDSAFQTLGLRHLRFGSMFSFLGKVYSIVVPVGFAIIPIYYIIFK